MFLVFVHYCKLYIGVIFIQSKEVTGLHAHSCMQPVKFHFWHATVHTFLLHVCKGSRLLYSFECNKLNLQKTILKCKWYVFVVNFYFADENMIRIHFSISEGIVMIYPQPKAPKSETGRRMTKHSLVSHDTSSASPGKESKMQLHPGDKKDRKDGRLTARLKLEKQKEEEAKLKRQASMDKKKKEKKDKKIVVKDASEEHSPSDLKPSPKASPPIGARRLSSDKSRRLSQLVEALNTERVERMQSQNRRFSKLIKLDEVVTVAMQELSESGSLFS